MSTSQGPYDPAFDKTVSTSQGHFGVVWSAHVTLKQVKKKNSVIGTAEIQDILGMLEIHYRSSQAYGIKSNHDTFPLMYFKVKEQIFFQILPNSSLKWLEKKPTQPVLNCKKSEIRH